MLRVALQMSMKQASRSKSTSVSPSRRGRITDEEHETGRINDEDVWGISVLEFVHPLNVDREMGCG